MRARLSQVNEDYIIAAHDNRAKIFRLFSDVSIFVLVFKKLRAVPQIQIKVIIEAQ